MSDDTKIDTQSLELILSLFKGCKFNTLSDQERLRILRIIAAIIAKILEIDIQVTI